MGLRDAAPYLLLGGAALALLAFLNRSDADAGGVAPGDSVLLAGDSLGVGTASHLLALLPAENAFTSVVHVGWTAKALLSALEQAPSVGGSIAVLSIGTNDEALLDPSTEEDALTQLFALLRDRGARRILWLVPPNFAIPNPPGAATPAKQNAFRAMMIAGDVEPIEPSPAIVALLGSDRMHLPPAGYELFAQSVIAALQ